MALPGKLDFTKISTPLLLSLVALPVSVAAFTTIYVSDDPFWSVLWMNVVLPIVWMAVVVICVKDGVKRRSWRQIVGSLALLAPTVLLFSLMLSPRFFLHQLFTFRPVDWHIPATGFALIQKFSVCAPDAKCTSESPVTETKTFRLTKVPEGCCSLNVVNGRGDKYKVETVRIVLNSEQVNLPPVGSLQIATVRLARENNVTVQLAGPPDAYIYVFISYTGKKDAPATQDGHPTPE